MEEKFNYSTVQYCKKTNDCERLSYDILTGIVPSGHRFSPVLTESDF